MDFNIYDFLGRPPEKTKNNSEFCQHCREMFPYSKDWDMCEMCGKSKNEELDDN